jgi:hypothetical protein
MIKAVAPAFRWRELLENGTHATIEEFAAAEKINASYIVVSCGYGRHNPLIRLTGLGAHPHRPFGLLRNVENLYNLRQFGVHLRNLGLMHATRRRLSPNNCPPGASETRR